MWGGIIIAYRSGFFTVPVMNVVVSALLFKYNIGVTLIELSVVLGVHLYWFELLDSVDFDWVFTSLIEEGLGLSLQLVHILNEVVSVESASIIVFCFNHYCS